MQLTSTHTYLARFLNNCSVYVSTGVGRGAKGGGEQGFREVFCCCFFCCISSLFLSSLWCLWFMPRLWLLFAAHVLFIDFNTICYFGNKNLINKKGDSFATSRVKEQDLESRLLLLSPQRPIGPFLCQQNRHAKSWASLKYYVLEGNMPPYIRPATGTTAAFPCPRHWCRQC